MQGAVIAVYVLCAVSDIAIIAYLLAHWRR